MTAIIWKLETNYLEHRFCLVVFSQLAAGLTGKCICIVLATYLQKTRKSHINFGLRFTFDR